MGFQEAPSGGELDIKALLGRALRLWYLFLIFPLLAFAGARLLLRYQVASYEVKGTIYLKESAEDQALARVTGQLGGAFGKDNYAYLTNQIEILSSYKIMQEVVDSLDLAVTYRSEGRLKNTDLYERNFRPALLASYQSNEEELYNLPLQITLSDSDSSYQLQIGEDFSTQGQLGETLFLAEGQIRIVPNPAASSGRRDFTLLIASHASAVGKYRSKLRITPVRNSELLEIRAEDEVPQRAIDIINAVLQAYERNIINEKHEVANKILRFVDDRLDYLSQELNEVEEAAENYVLNNDLVGGTEREIESSFARLQRNEQELAALQLRTEGLNQVARKIGSGDSLSYLAYQVVLDYLNLTPLIQNYNQLLLERDRLKSSAQPNNPVFQPLEQRIQEAERTIRQGLAEGKAKLEKQQQALRQDTDSILKGIRKIPSKQRGLLAIERQQSIREQLYLFLLQKREESALSSARAVSNVQIWEPPMRRGSTSMPPLQIYGIAIFLGLLLPAGIVFLVETLDNTIKSPEQIKKLTQAPVLGAIAQGKGKKQIVVSPSSRTAIAEMFRMLRTNIQFLGAGREQHLLLVTSSMGGEGKTFFTVNMGLSLAITGKRVVVIGMDLRKPKLGQYLMGEEPKTGGLSSYLAGSASSWSEVVRHSEIHEQLDFIPAGPVPPNPAELLMLPKTKELLQQLRQEYDYILLDLPPVGLVADALLLAEQADATLFITRFGKTKKDQIALPDELYRTGKLPQLAIVLNGVKNGAGYGYGYGYGYGGYYQED